MATAAPERPTISAEDLSVAATEQDQPILEQVRLLLAEQCEAKLVGPDGKEIALPAAVFRVLSRAVEHMRRGDAVTILPIHRELTSQEAADLLNVSRPYLVRLLEKGEIPYRRLNKHRRIKFGDLMAYKRQRDERRRTALDELTELSQELGLYGVAPRETAPPQSG